MSILIFIIILAVLILAHEFGHFSVARFFKIRVEEFGIGFPPRIKTLFIKKGSRFTLNAIPFGGFVKLFGESINEEDIDKEIPKDSFVVQKMWVQALVLIAGVVANILIAWLFISLSFTLGLRGSVGIAPNGANISNQETSIVNVLPNSPADKAGLSAGDVILAVSVEGETLTNPSMNSLISLMNTHYGRPVILSRINKNEDKVETITVVPKEIEKNKKMIGIGIDTLGTIKLPFLKSFLNGAIITIHMTGAVATALVGFIINIIHGSADLSSISGPIGIVGIVGDTASSGFSALLTLTALISINLAVINIFPIPALDGGRLLFILIEWVRGKRIKPSVFNIVNTIGFFLLISLMIFVTYHDIIKLF